MDLPRLIEVLLRLQARNQFRRLVTLAEGARLHGPLHRAALRILQAADLEAI